MQVSVDEMLKPDDQPMNRVDRKNQYFSLQNDGESAVVRFLHQDINDFEVLDVHNIKLGGYNRKINCLRTPNGSKEECALCSANVYDEERGAYAYPLQRKFFIHLLRYDNPQTATAQVWERSKDYIKKLHQLVEDYGPLCDRLYKIVRHGAAGAMDTTYDILPLDKDRFNPEQFVFDRNQLNYEKALGGIVLNESNEAIKEFLETGNFPSFNNRQKKEEVTPRPTAQPTQAQVNPQPQTFNQEPRQNNFNSYNNDFNFDGPRKRV